MPEKAFDGDGGLMDLEECFRLASSSESVWTVLWDPSTEEDPDDMQAVSLEKFTMRHWKLGKAGLTATAANTVELDPTGEMFTAAAWNPHTNNLIATGVGKDVLVWDLRCKPQKAVQTIFQAHSGTIRSMDYNPDRLYTLATGAEDGTVKFWDIKNSKEPLKVLKGHSHWTSCIKYNRQYDQLVLSSGTDAVVNLWKMFSISSGPLSEEYDPTQVGDAQEDRLVAKYDDEDDSIYTVAWGDAWVYASLSYGGKLVVYQVPMQEKYGILL